MGLAMARIPLDKSACRHGAWNHRIYKRGLDLSGPLRLPLEDQRTNRSQSRQPVLPQEASLPG